MNETIKGNFMFKIVLAMLLITGIFAQTKDLELKCETTNFQKTGNYKNTIEYCKTLEKHFPEVKYLKFGKSSQQYDLPLLIIDGDKKFSPNKVKKTNKIVLLIQAGIHPGEICGKDAGLMLIRDILQKKENKHLLEKITILFIPVFNTDGFNRFGKFNRINQNGPNEMGWRVNGQNLNLNRDYLKADTPEMKAWLKLYNEWEPDFFIDCHSTDGADFQYQSTYVIEVFGNTEKKLSEWLKKTYEPKLQAMMNKKNMPIFPYVSFKNWHDPESGMIAWAGIPRISQTYVALRNRPALLIESHMLKPYKERVYSTKEMIKSTIKILYESKVAIKKLIKNADNYTASKKFREQPYTLSYKNLNDSNMVKFKGFKYKKIPSELSGGIWYKYSTQKKNFELAYFNKKSSYKTVKIPEYYIIPPEWIEVIEKVKIHGIKTIELQKPVELKVSTYRFTSPKWNQRSYEGRHFLKVNITEIEQKKVFPKGSIVIKTAQKNARIIAHILEPEAPDSYIKWGFFNSIFEQKEYAESYVMEKMAREMLKADPLLKAEFEKKCNEDLAFKNNPRSILNWFYSKTEYWDNKKNVYPVGRIFDGVQIENSL